MNKTEKSEVISNVVEMINKSSAVYVTNYSGINVADITNIRNEFRKEKVSYFVVKNTFFKRAINETGRYNELVNNLAGMSGFAFTNADPIAPAKIIKKYFDASQKLSLKACYIENQFYDGSRLNEIASLPSKPEIIAGILGSLSSPASGIIGAINAVFRDLVSVVDQISKKQAA